MGGERAHLIQRVVPALRQRCETYRLRLVEVDMRWGVTEAEAREGKVLEICLTEGRPRLSRPLHSTSLYFPPPYRMYAVLGFH